MHMCLPSFNRMKKTITILSFLIASILSSMAYAFDGPLQVKNQFPLFLHINAPSLESAIIEDSFSGSLSYSSVYLARDSSEWSMGLDVEIAELNLNFKKTIKDYIEIGVGVPVLSFTSGFMDDFLNAYHSTFGFSDYGRHDRPENKFLYEVRRNGFLIVKGENGRTGIGDIKFTLKKPLLQGDPAVSIKGDIEIPTGDAKTGFGNGSIDAAIALLVDKNIGETFKSHVNLGIVFPGDLRGHESVGLRNFIYGGAALEAALRKEVTLIGQLFIQQSPFPKTTIGPVDRTAVLLSLGGRYYYGKNNFDISLTEDPNTAGAADFILNFSFKRRF
jgi:hypothetical protein